MREILGNKKGIRDSVLNELIALYDVQVPLGQLISAELFHSAGARGFPARAALGVRLPRPSASRRHAHPGPLG